MLSKSTGLFLCTLFLLGAVTHAQMLVKTSDDAVILIATQDQKIGIGLTAPIERLDVNGAIKIGNTAQNTTGAIRWSGADFEGYDGSNWKSLTVTGGSNWTKIGADIFYNYDKVGIGLSNPAYPLHVGRISKFEDHAYFTGKGISASMTSDDLQGANPHPFMKVDFDWTTPVSHFGKILHINWNLSGSAAIPSMSNPDGFICIAGEVNHNGTFMHGNPWANYYSYTHFNSGNCELHPWSAFRDAPHFLGASFDAYSSFSAAPIFNSSATIKNYIFFHGITASASTDNITNMYGIKLEPIRFGENNYAVHIGDPQDGNAYDIYALGGRNYFGGSVGIGATNPSEKLEVAGGVRVGNTSSSNIGTIRWSGSDFEGYTASGWKSLTTVGGSLWSQNGSKIFYNSDNVGIGTTSPASKLEIAGTDNKLQLSYGSAVNADIATDSHGDLMINSSNKKVFVNVNPAIAHDQWPKSHFVILSEQPPTFTVRSDSRNGLVVTSMTQDELWAVGAAAYAQTTKADAWSSALGLAGSAFGASGVHEVIGVLGSSDALGASNAFGGKFSTNTGITHTTPLATALLASISNLGTIQSARGLAVTNWYNSGTVQNSYGIYLDNSIDVGSTSRYALYSSSNSSSYLAGSLGIGMTTPAAPLHIYGSTNKIKLSYDAGNYSDFNTVSDGTLVINPSQKRVFVNDQGVTKSGFPNTALIVTSDQPIGLYNGGETGIASIASSADKDATGILVYGGTEKTDGEAIAISAWANGYVNASSVTGLSAMASGNGARRIYGAKLSIHQGNNSGNPYPSATNALMQLNSGTGVVIDSVRMVDYKGYNRGHHGTVNNSYGIYMDTSIDIGAVSRYAIYCSATSSSYFEGNAGFGINTPQRKLHIKDVMRLEPRATAPASPSEGDLYYNSTDHKLYAYDGSTWQACW